MHPQRCLCASLMPGSTQRPGHCSGLRAFDTLHPQRCMHDTHLGARDGPIRIPRLRCRTVLCCAATDTLAGGGAGCVPGRLPRRRRRHASWAAAGAPGGAARSRRAALLPGDHAISNRMGTRRQVCCPRAGWAHSTYVAAARRCCSAAAVLPGFANERVLQLNFQHCRTCLDTLC